MVKVAGVPAYRIEVSLLDVKPPIWRRVVVPGGWHLGKVHDVVQAAFGWTDSHLHEFERGERRWGMPDPDWDTGVQREATIRLYEIVPEVGDRLTYTYDFGDGWRHSLLLEELLPPQRAAVCLEGRRACPPEDCGGPCGYEELLGDGRSDASRARREPEVARRSDRPGGLRPPRDRRRGTRSGMSDRGGPSSEVRCCSGRVCWSVRPRVRRIRGGATRSAGWSRAGRRCRGWTCRVR